MKKSLLLLSLATVAFTSCKKDIEQKELTANETTGTGYIKGTFTKPVITPNGPNPWVSGWNNGGQRVPAAGVNITVRVAKSGSNGLYPNSSIQGTDVYTGTTDANGNFNIAVKSNGSNGGVQATVLVEAWQGTFDTVIGNVVKPGKLCNYFGFNTTQQVYVGQSTNYTGPFGTGTTWQFNNNMGYANDIAGPGALNTGTATITGSASINIQRYFVAVLSGTNQPAVFSTTNVPVPAGTKVYYTFNTDPTTLSTRIYQTNTDAAGGYSFNVATIASVPAIAGFNQNGNVWIGDFAQSRDTVRVTSIYTGTSMGTATFVSSSTVTATGLLGTWNVNGTQIPQNSLFNGELRNGTNFNFGAGNFVPN